MNSLCPECIQGILMIQQMDLNSVCDPSPILAKLLADLSELTDVPDNHPTGM